MGVISTTKPAMLTSGLIFKKIDGLDTTGPNLDIPVITCGNKITYNIKSSKIKSQGIAHSGQFSNLFLDRVPPKIPFGTEIGCFMGVISGGLSGGTPAFKRLENINNVAGIRLFSKAGE